MILDLNGLIGHAPVLRHREAAGNQGLFTLFTPIHDAVIGNVAVSRRWQRAGGIPSLTSSAPQSS